MFGKRGNDDGSRATPDFRPPAQPVIETPPPASRAPEPSGPTAAPVAPAPVVRRPVEPPPLAAEPRKLQRERSES